MEEKGVMPSRGNKGEVVREGGAGKMVEREVVREGGAGKMVVSEAMSER